MTKHITSSSCNKSHKIILKPSHRKDKKYMALVDNKTVHFGAKGYQDYTTHKDAQRMKRYITRHKARENWNMSGIQTPGFWARHILWSSPSFSDAVAKTSKKFKVCIVNKTGRR